VSDGGDPAPDGGESDSGTQDSDAGTVSGTIGPTGGTVESADGKARLDVPAGALSSPVEISITTLPIDDTLPIGTLAAVELGPSGQTFDVPVTITLSFRSGDIPSGDSASDLCIGQLVKSAWVVSKGIGSCEVDADAKTVSTTTTHFSIFGIYPPAKTLTVMKAGSGDGSVEMTPFGIAPPEFVCMLATCIRTYVHGTVVVLEAVPGVDSVFDGWSGDCSGSSPDENVNLLTSQSCEATFSSSTPVDCSGTTVCTADYPCQDLTPGYSCLGQFADWTPSDSPSTFTDNSDGTVTDSRSGLVWQQVVDAGSYTWANAKSYCAALSLAGSSAWRLPTKAELESVVDFGRSNPAIDPTAFPSAPSALFWTSSPSAVSAGSAWHVDFDSAYTGFSDASTMVRVRCVR
jgi:hypothetical protein